MSDESARLEALLQVVPIFATLERVELAHLVGALEETDLAAHEVIFTVSIPYWHMLGILAR